MAEADRWPAIRSFQRLSAMKGRHHDGWVRRTARAVRRYLVGVMLRRRLPAMLLGALLSTLAVVGCDGKAPPTQFIPWIRADAPALAHYPDAKLESMAHQVCSTIRAGRPRTWVATVNHLVGGGIDRHVSYVLITDAVQAFCSPKLSGVKISSHLHTT